MEGYSCRGQERNPHNVAVAPDGSVYTLDFNYHLIQKFTSAGAVILRDGGCFALTTGTTGVGRFQADQGPQIWGHNSGSLRDMIGPLKNFATEDRLCRTEATKVVLGTPLCWSPQTSCIQSVLFRI